MIEIYSSKLGNHIKTHLNLNLKGMRKFGAEIFNFQIQSGITQYVRTWDNRVLECISGGVVDTVADAFGKSDLLGLRLPKEYSKEKGFINLESKLDEWGQPETIKIIRAKDNSSISANYLVYYKDKKIGELENFPVGNSDGEIRELIIAAINLVR